jgi:hypothetical protein
MATAPGFAKDFVSRRRIADIEVVATSSILSKRASHLQDKSDGESPSGALKGFLDMRYKSACAEFSPC